MKVKLKVTTSRASRMEELVKASNFYTATKFPDRSSHMRNPKKALILEFWDKRLNGFKIGNI